jgi:hypothetical protein
LAWLKQIGPGERWQRAMTTTMAQAKIKMAFSIPGHRS